MSTHNRFSVFRMRYFFCSTLIVLWCHYGSVTFNICLYIGRVSCHLGQHPVSKLYPKLPVTAIEIQLLKVKIMLPIRLKKHLTLVTVFKLVCISFTSVFLFQELEIYFLLKPTVTSSITEPLHSQNIPIILACADPAMNSTVMAQNGYSHDNFFYALGILIGGRNSHGWNGNSSGISTDLLDKMSTLEKANDIKAWEIKSAWSRLKRAATKLTPFIYPNGKCIQVSHKYDALRNRLIVFKKPNVKDMSNRLVILLKDPINSADMYPLEMKGDRMISFPNEDKTRRKAKVFRIKIHQLIHEKEDPNFPCYQYSMDDTLNSCVRNEVLKILKNHFGCIPPTFSGKLNETCNSNFNKTRKDFETSLNLLDTIYQRFKSKVCPSPCTKTSYEVKLVYEVSSKYDQTIISFDEITDIERNLFSINPNTFLTRLGGSISFGRTSLWVFILTLEGVTLIWTGLYKITMYFTNNTEIM